MEAGKQVLSVSLSVEEEASVCWRPHLNDLQNIITYLDSIQKHTPTHLPTHPELSFISLPT